MSLASKQLKALRDRTPEQLQQLERMIAEAKKNPDGSGGKLTASSSPWGNEDAVRLSEFYRA